MKNTNESVSLFSVFLLQHTCTVHVHMYMYISTVHCLFHQDLNRMVVKADTATVRIPELEFEIPSHTQKGRITTIESILMQSVEGLEKEQPIRKVIYSSVI